MDFYNWKGFCINCGEGLIKDSNDNVLGVKYEKSRPKNWIKVKTSNKRVIEEGKIIELKPEDNVYVYVCSPKCAHEMEEFFTGGGVEYAHLDDSGNLKWEPEKLHL